MRAKFATCDWSRARQTAEVGPVIIFSKWHFAIAKPGSFLIAVKLIHFANERADCFCGMVHFNNSCNYFQTLVL